MIVMDATRADHLSSYGYQRSTTPNIDRIAAEGAIYEQAISPAPWTLPAVASLFTGLYASQHGTHASHQYLDTHFLTLAELLRSRGYRTALFPNVVWIDEPFGLHRGFDTYGLPGRLPLFDRLFKRVTIIEKAYRRLFGRPYESATRDTNRRIKEWLTTEFEDGVPFFINVHYGNPHLPHRFREPYTALFLGHLGAEAKKVNQDPHRYMAGQANMTEEDFEILKALYDGEIAYLDSMLNQVFELLRERGILDDTLLIITADHGENIGDHGLMAHQYCLYDTLIHVPLIIRYPRLFAAGHREKSQVQTHEIFTTIMDILGIEKEEVVNDVRGRSLIPAKIAAQPLPFAISEDPAPNLAPFRRKCPGFDPSKFDRRLRAVRCDGYKYVWASDGRHELYNLVKDPHELENLIQTQAEKAEALQEKLDNWLESIDQPESGEMTLEVDDEIKDRLKALGYL
jgi:arylsulfatase A-like enzyme